MGKGDKRTKRGKICRSTFGKCRNSEAKKLKERAAAEAGKAAKAAVAG